MNSRKILGYIVTLLVLVGFPLLAFYYVNKGVRYRQDLASSLEDYGTIAPIFENKRSTEEKVAVLFFLNGSADKLTFEKIHQQFDNRTDVIFLVHGDYTIQDSTQVWGFEKDTHIDLMNALNKASTSFNSEGFLINRTGHLVKKYNLSNRSEIQLLVKHIAYFLPPKKTPKAELKREIEK